MTFPEWVDLAAAFVRVEAAACGWRVKRAKRAASSRSVYIELECVAGGFAVVRLSDHRCAPCQARRRSLFSVRQRATSRLRALRAFLSARAGRVLSGS